MEEKEIVQVWFTLNVVFYAISVSTAELRSNNDVTMNKALRFTKHQSNISLNLVCLRISITAFIIKFTKFITVVKRSYKYYSCCRNPLGSLDH